MSYYCADCVEKAKLRNRDMTGQLKIAKQYAIQDQKPYAVCWTPKEGLYTRAATDAIKAGATIRHIVSGLL